MKNKVKSTSIWDLSNPNPWGFNSTTNTTAKKKKRYHIYWDRIILLLMIIATLIGWGYKIASLLKDGSKTQKIVSASSQQENAHSDVETSETEIKPETETKPETQTFPLSIKDKITLARCIVHERCGQPVDYLSIKDKEKYYSLINNENRTPDEEIQLSNFESLFNYRYDLAEQLIAMSILNRINKEGFGVNGFSEPGYIAKNIDDVISQPKQFEGILENNNISIDARTIKNIENMLTGQTIIDIPQNLFYEISYKGIDLEGAKDDLLHRMDSKTQSVEVFCILPCSYFNEQGVLEDHLQVFGTNSTNTGFGSPDP